MATENIDRIITREAGAEVTNKRFVVEKVDGKVELCGAGAAAHGVVAALYIPDGATQTIAAGLPVPVATGGDVIVTAGAVVADGAEVMSDANGKAITFAAGGGAIALGLVVNNTAAGADGDDITVRLYANAQHI